MEEGFGAFKTRQKTQTSHVETMERELTTVRTQQGELSDRVNRTLAAIRHQRSNPGNIQITAEGMTNNTKITSNK